MDEEGRFTETAGAELQGQSVLKEGTSTGGSRAKKIAPKKHVLNNN